jgi:glycosyltransferase involved in cell wall biosynthesis
VTHVIQRYFPAVGGSEVWCREVSHRLAEAGDEVSVLTLSAIEEEEYWRRPPLGACTTRLGRLEWDGPILVRRYPPTLPVHSLYHGVFDRVLYRRLGIHFYGPHSAEWYAQLPRAIAASDVVHLHTVPYPHNFVAYLAARRAGKRVVITPHFHPDHPHYELWSNYWLLRRCDTVFTVSEYERDYLAARGVKRRTLVVTGNGVQPEEYRSPGDGEGRRALRKRAGVPDDARIVAFIGRKTEYKGLPTLVSALREVRRRQPAWALLAGPSSPWFDAFYGGLCPEDRAAVVDLGTVSHADKVELLHAADVLVLPSAFEAFGIVFLEAWMCGTPVIGAARGAMPSVIADAGLTFEHGSSADLARAIEAILADREGARAMAQRGRLQVETRYTWARIAATVRAAYCAA